MFSVSHFFCSSLQLCSNCELCLRASCVVFIDRMAIQRMCYTLQTALMNGIVRSRGVLITAYSTVLIHQDLLLGKDWHYIILDEGHKIRNPDAQITLVCKQVAAL